MTDLSLPDRVSVDLRRKMASDDRDDELMTIAGAKRGVLVDDWIQEGSRDSFEEMVAELSASNPSITTLLRRMLSLTEKGVSLGKEINRDALIGASATLCRFIRDEADRLMGDELVNREANRLASE